MTRARVESAQERTCYRCSRSLTDEHWVRLAAEHGGQHANAFQDVSRHLCGDCAAGIGMLEIVKREREGHENRPSESDKPSSGR